MSTPTLHTTVTAAVAGDGVQALTLAQETFAPVGEVGVVITGPGPDLYVDGADIPTPHPDLYIEDRLVRVRRYGACVTVGCGAVLIADQDVTCEVEVGATVYLAPGAHLQDAPIGALERGDITVVHVPSLSAGHAHTTWTTPKG